eukprot:NODE_73_length_23464_cov_0.600171.p12 type:complete len:102 gc:universal NODE_73_length_23464_cov_0.600171:13826-14131(+)
MLSCQLGLQQGFSGSCCIVSNFFCCNNSTPSIILMIKCGGLANFRTALICDGCILLSALAASSNAGFAASSSASAILLSFLIISAISWQLNLTFKTSSLTT